MASAPANGAVLIADFCSLTELGPPEKNGHAEFAQSFLEGNGWSLELAIHAYLEFKAENGAVGGATSADDAAAIAAAMAPDGEDPVRAPLPDKQERLFDESPEEVAQRIYQSQTMRRNPPRNTANSLAAGIPQPRAPSSVDPFRNFAAEQGWRPAAAASSGARGSKAAAGSKANLSQLFAPPDELLCKDPATGAPLGWEAATNEALAQRKWLIINLQQSDEFSSHQLNRDVWRHPSIAALIKEHFVFCQLSNATAEGARYLSLYRPPAVPSVALIDPETRAKLWDCHADTMRDIAAGAPPRIEDSAKKGELQVGKLFIQRLLKVFTEWANRKDLNSDGAHIGGDTGGDGFAAAAAGGAAGRISEEERLLQQAIKASLSSSPAASPAKSSRPATSNNGTASASVGAGSRSTLSGAVKPNHRATPTGAIILDSSSSDEHGTEQHSEADEEYIPISDSDGEMDARLRSKQGRRTEESDDDEVAVVPKQSFSQAAVGDKRKRASQEGEDESKTAAVSKVSRTSSNTATFSSAATSSAPVVPIPEEPALGPAVCRLQIRLPTGKPVQRRFLRSEPIKGVLAFARSLMPDETAHKKLLIVSSHPRRELADEEMSIEAHGVVNSSVIVEVVE